MLAYLTNIRTGLYGPPGPLPCPPSRIIIEATAPLEWLLEKGGGRKTSLILPGAKLNMPPGIINVWDGLITRVLVTRNGGGNPRFLITTLEETGCTVTEVPGLPYRLVLDLDRSPLLAYFQNQHVVLDPYWDGKRKGAVSPTGLPEHIPTLDIARRLAQLLTGVKARVNLTRLDAYYVPVADRLQLCRELQPTLFLSIATWVNRKKPQSGFRIRYYPGRPENEFLAACLEGEMQRKLSIPSHGRAAVNMTLLREAPVPAALIEAACISHRLDEGLLRDVDFRQRVAQALFNGINQYLRNKGHL